MASTRVFAVLFWASLSGAACSGGGGLNSTGTTPTPGATPTPNPTGTPEAGVVGCRPYQISSGVDGTCPTCSYVEVSALSGTDLSELQGAGGLSASGPLTLCGGQLSGGKAALTLQQDVTVAVSLPQSNCVCAQYLSAGTTGTVYCAASSDPLDFTSTLNSNADAQPAPGAVQTDGPGKAAHPGDLRIIFTAKATGISQAASGCTPGACQAALASVSTTGPVLYTTGNATSTITNSKQGGTVTVSLPGQSLSADSSGQCNDWTAATTKGALSGAAAQQEAVSGVGDVAIIERMGEK